MALNVNNLLRTQQTQATSATSATGKVSSESTPSSLANGRAAVSSMLSGSTFSGKVISSENGQVTIQLSDNATLQANVRGNLTLSNGTNATFLINSKADGQVSLTPLFTNLSASANITNALHAAGLPVTEDNAAMVQTMMEKSMSVSSEALLDMVKLCNEHTDVSPANVVKLDNLNLPISQEAAQQLENYENLNHQISNGVDDIVKDLTEALQNSAQQAAEGATLSEGQGFLNALAGENGGLGAQFLSLLTGARGEEAQLSQDALPGEGNAAELAEANSLDNPANEAVAQGRELLLNVMDLAGENTGGETVTLSSDQMQGLLQTLQSHNGAESLPPNENGVFNQADITELLHNLPKDSAMWKELLQDSTVQDLLKQSMQNSLLMRPDKVADKSEVEQYFNQLKGQLGKLEQTASEILGDKNPISHSTTNLTQNVDFLNELNKTFTYIQIPLQMSDQTANGDLYVFTNKKSLAESNGKVSAYLHLDMDHLGSVDCYVNMENTKVSTNFKVRDDEVLDLIEDNIDLLNERLEKRGYTLKANVDIAGEDTNVIHEMEKELGGSSLPLVQYSFDAKA